jgi:hypothetical protein
LHTLFRSNTHMKRAFLVLLPLLLAAPLIAGAFLDFFQGRSDGNNIFLEWKVRSETNVTSYDVQRKAGYGGEFTTIASVEPKSGSGYYSFTDRSAYKAQDNIYIYRLKIADANGSASYSNDVTVSHSVSSVKRTWGSIKAMFR